MPYLFCSGSHFDKWLKTVQVHSIINLLYVDIGLGYQSFHVEFTADNSCFTFLLRDERRCKSFLRQFTSKGTRTALSAFGASSLYKNDVFMFPPNYIPSRTCNVTIRKFKKQSGRRFQAQSSHSGQSGISGKKSAGCFVSVFIVTIVFHDEYTFCP